MSALAERGQKELEIPSVPPDALQMRTPSVPPVSKSDLSVGAGEGILRQGRFGDAEHQS
jgi:hypothetical protein